ncbi:unnamed protein product [Didymodactylos carnosus]|uniref:Uncharacterized protein n=1 Tax=Didymodactylos carnosus TaxID=1234261 RepID=A0A813Q4S4_9BILA|nr:unnamed protein product [Didymodactylos carnosus]CAF0762002.1 unnamed protein product [Didymodactylos carnosus]CAF3526175.1 unnamed protein product [Didymodactylos carnosus]CAF3543023.1 unnamed protein product [Didymodactylos carnosus]
MSLSSTYYSSFPSSRKSQHQLPSSIPFSSQQPKRTIPKHNRYLWLRSREVGYRTPPVVSRSNNARFLLRQGVYRSIYPSYSILMATVPTAIYLRRFSPNGKYLLTFSQDVQQLIVYNYLGFERVYESLEKCSSSTNYTRLDDTDSGLNSKRDFLACENLRESTFDQIFSVHCKIPIKQSSSQSGYTLNRNHIYCLFSRDQYAIICSSKLVNEQQHPPYAQLVQTNEDLNPLSRFYFEHFLIYLIDYHNGYICQQLEFQYDRIGLTLYDSTLAILSIQHQKIHLYHVDELNGKLIEILTIGKFTQPDEEFLYNYSLPKHLLLLASSKNKNKYKKGKFFTSFYSNTWGSNDNERKIFRRRPQQLTDEIDGGEGGLQAVHNHQVDTHSNESTASSSSSTDIVLNPVNDQLKPASFVRDELNRLYHFSPSTDVPSTLPTVVQRSSSFTSHSLPGQSPYGLARSIFQRDRRNLLLSTNIHTSPFSHTRTTNIQNYQHPSEYSDDFSTMVRQEDFEQDTTDDNGDYDESDLETTDRFGLSSLYNIENDFDYDSSQIKPMLPMNDRQFSTLKQRLLTFLYKRAKSMHCKLKFVQTFNDYLLLKFYKMQFLSKDILLLKFAHEEIVNKRQQENGTYYSLFVVYNIRQSSILNVYDDSSQELAKIFEIYNDEFRSSASLSTQKLEYYPLSTYSGRQQFQQQYKINMSPTSSDGGENVKKLLVQLPLRTLTHTTSPYLDLSLYSYDDKVISLDDMIKACPNNPIRFFCRGCQRMKFQLTLTHRSIQTTAHDNITTTIITPAITNNSHTSANSNTNGSQRRSTLATIWHPIEPFVITIQRWPREADNIHNIHLYRPPTLQNNK